MRTASVVEQLIHWISDDTGAPNFLNKCRDVIAGKYMNASDTKYTDAIERQRERVRFLCRNGRYEDAADLCAALSDEVLIFTPCEAIADYLSKKRPAEAARLYGV